MADWTTLGAGLVGAAVALAGSLGGQVFRSRNETEREVKDRHLRFRDMRRSAYADLLAASSRVISYLDPTEPLPTPERLVSLDEAFHRAAALAELYAEPAHWMEMRGLLEIAQLRMGQARSRSEPESATHLEDELHSLGADTREGVERWREKYVQAARIDLSL